MSDQPRDQRRPSLVSLFTGAGGLDIGLEVAGFHTVAAVDIDEDSVATLAANQARRVKVPGDRSRVLLDGTKLLCRSVVGLAADELRPENASTSWCPDLLAGGPPCQPFSSAGKQLGLDDPRGRLFEEFVRLAECMRPKVILMENVRGMVTAPGPSGRPGEALDLVRRSFEAIGYATSFMVLNSADFGVPQRRVRLFMMATRGSPLPTFPDPTHSELGSLFGAKPWVTLGDFLSRQPPPLPDDITRPTPSLADQLKLVANGSGLKSPGAREATRPGGHWGYKQGTFIADLEKPARTVTAATTQDWVRWRGDLRRLTWGEVAGLQGFPTNWEFVGGKASRFRQIGNAVPVAFGRLLGAAILESLSRWKTRPADSAPWPESFVAAAEYTDRERKRNGASRAAARAAAPGIEGVANPLKGVGSRPGAASSRKDAA